MDRVGRFQINIDGREVPNILSINLQRGLEQEYGTLELVLPQPTPSYIRKWSSIHAVLGVVGDDDNFAERFTGYVLDIGESYYPGRETITCGDMMVLLANFYPLDEVSFVDLTDEAIVTRVLEEVGIPSDMMVIAGTGRKITTDFGLTGSPAVTWPFVQSALDVIREIDSISVLADGSGAYRTFCDSSGIIRRVLITEFPGEFPAYTFTYGDILAGSTSKFIQRDPKTEVNLVAAGGTGSHLDLDNPLTWRRNSWWDMYRVLVAVATDIGIFNATDLAAWVFALLNRNIVTVTISTMLSMVIEPNMTIKVNDPEHLRVNQTFWTQSYNLSVDNKGIFRQSINLISEWDFNPLSNSGSSPGINTPLTPPGSLIPPGTPIIPPAPPVVIPPSDADIMPTLSIVAIDKETIIVGGVEVPLYVVSAVDLSTSLQGTIASRSWLASGTGVVTTTGTEKTFTTAFTDLASATIQLTIIDSNGNTGNVTRAVSTAGIPTRARKLYAATDTEIEAFDGTNWRVYTPSNAAAPSAIGPGPLWGAGDLSLHTEDDLDTAAVEHTPFGAGTDVTAVWVEPDVSSTRIAAGASDGRVAVSINNGTSYSIYDGPGGLPIRKIIISRFQPNQIHAITNTGYYVSDTSGTSWRLILAGDFIDLELANGRNVLVTSAGGLVLAAKEATPFTFPGTPSIVCVAAHIRQDKFYALASDGSSYATTTSGGFAMEQRVSIPLGTPQVRGMHRDGLMIDVVYFAAGDGGLWKTSNGFKTSGSYHKLREGVL